MNPPEPTLENEPIYRGMTRSEVADQYDPRAAVADSATWRAHWSLASARARMRFPLSRDIPYGPSAGQKLDVVSKAAGGPIIVFIHGGAWRGSDKGDHAFVIEPMVDAGATAVLLNYDLCPAVTLPEIVEQVRRAVAWVYRNAEAIGGDRDRLYVCGHGAGGHLSAMLTSAGWQAQHDIPGDAIKGAAMVSAWFDVEPALYVPGGEELGLDRESARTYSPMFGEPDIDIPLLVAVGALEAREWTRQTEEYVNLRRTDGVQVELLKPDDDHHYSILFTLANETSALGKAVLAQMCLEPGAAARAS